MNDRYGVDPDAATSMLELASLLRNFRPGEGRFIVDFPPNWTSHAGSSFRGASDLERARLTELLWRAKRSLLPTKTLYFHDRPWATNAERLTEVLARIGPPGSTPPFRALTDVLTDPEGFRDCRGGHIPRTPEAYAEVVKPLLQISPKVALIDPYFRLRSWDQRWCWRYRRPFVELLRAAQAVRKVEVFKLVVCPVETMIDRDNGARFNADLDELRSEAGCTDLKTEWRPLPDPKIGPKQHARYLLGKECGLHFDHGFDVAKVKSTNHVEWIGKSALTPLLQQFM